MRAVVVGLGTALVLYLLAIGGLLLLGRTTAARELAMLIPNLVLLFKDLVRDPRVPKRTKALLIFGAAWIASPIDLIPEFIPFLGPLDDAIVAALILRHLVRKAGPEIVMEHWRGDPATIAPLLGRASSRPPENGERAQD